MRLDSLYYRLAYRLGRPAWDTGEPEPELNKLALGHVPGRALDLGCGTGTDAIDLARRGWQVVGIDFASEAIDKAKAKAAAAGVKVDFVVGDVSRLRDAGITGPFDVLIDIGCYHAIPAGLRDSYAAEVAAVASPGADLYLAGTSTPPRMWRLLGAEGLNRDDLQTRFGPTFDFVEERTIGSMGRLSRLVLVHMVRKSMVQATVGG
jgi:SAM-dependent methyltransferase